MVTRWPYLYIHKRGHSQEPSQTKELRSKITRCLSISTLLPPFPTELPLINQRNNNNKLTTTLSHDMNASDDMVNRRTQAQQNACCMIFFFLHRVQKPVKLIYINRGQDSALPLRQRLCEWEHGVSFWEAGNILFLDLCAVTGLCSLCENPSRCIIMVIVLLCTNVPFP